MTCLSACITDAFEGWVEIQEFVLALTQANLLRTLVRGEKKKKKTCLVPGARCPFRNGWEGEEKKKFSMETTDKLSFSLPHSESLCTARFVLSTGHMILQDSTFSSIFLWLRRKKKQKNAHKKMQAQDIFTSSIYVWWSEKNTLIWFFIIFAWFPNRHSLVLLDHQIFIVNLCTELAAN